MFGYISVLVRCLPEYSWGFILMHSSISLALSLRIGKCGSDLY